MRKVLILGGAGFIGSNLVKKFSDSDIAVTVIDALYENTGASLTNLNNCLDKIIFINRRVEDVENLSSIIEKHELVIDSMGWTSHHEAIKNPDYDIQLNLFSHLSVIKALEGQKGKTIIYLGSRGQYGNPLLPEVTEVTSMMPEDVQGISKMAAESYYRVYSKFFDFNFISLRIPNCFGENQPLFTNDIGLIGIFFKDIINNKQLIVYSSDRIRSLIYVKDLVDIIFDLCHKPLKGNNSFNVKGYELTIEEIAKSIIKVAGSGSYIVKKITKEIEAIDTGNARYNCKKINLLLPEFRYTEIEEALHNTYTYFCCPPKN